jgi:hypothetical protein
MPWMRASSPIQALFGEDVRDTQPTSHWEALHVNPSDPLAKLRLREAIQMELERLLGSKKIQRAVGCDAIVLRRSRLQYESHIEVYVAFDRHGFVVTVPSQEFRIRITCPRHVAPDVVGAPWDDLLANLCKIDRSVIKSRKSKSQPLSYVSMHGQHPQLRVEVLNRKQCEEAPSLPA